MQTAIEIHQEAKSNAIHFRKSHSKLLETLIRVDRHKIYKQFDYPNLHEYCTRWLGLTGAEAYSFGGVAQKAQEIPEMKTMIDEGKIHISNARRVVSVITPENKDIWLEKAAALSQHELRRAVVTEKPELEQKARIKPITGTRSRLELGIAVDLEVKLKKVCDLLSQKRQRDVSLEEALEFMTNGFLEKYDPVKKAERNLCPDTRQVIVRPGRFVAAQVTHEVNARDRRECQFRYPDGSRCGQRRWVEVHHLRPVAEGGMGITGNLVTLCSAHHRQEHRRGLT